MFKVAKLVYMNWCDLIWNEKAYNHNNNEMFEFNNLFFSRQNPLKSFLFLTLFGYRLIQICNVD